jgi:hypothetical protein
MVGKRAATMVAAAALLLGGGGVAYADDLLPGGDTALVRVTVPSQADVDKLVTSYDVVEYKHVEDDGSISLNIDTTAAERTALREKGYTIGRTVENAGSISLNIDTTAAQRGARRATRSGARSRTPRLAPTRRPSVTRPARPRHWPATSQRAA